MHMNPGTEPLPMGTEEIAKANMLVFAEDVAAQGPKVAKHERTPGKDYGEGRFAFTLALADERTFEVQMPGIPLERLRGDGTNPFAYHRLYVDGNSWLWDFGVSIVAEDWGDEHQGARSGARAVHCFIYAHVAQSNPVAVERQVEECRALAASLSDAATVYEVVRIFEDNGGSGMSGDRPAYKELLAALEQGDVATVLVSHEDRLSRSTALQQAYSELSSRLGITTYSESGPVC